MELRKCEAYLFPQLKLSSGEMTKGFRHILNKPGNNNDAETVFRKKVMLPTEQKPTHKLYLVVELSIAIFFVLGYNLFEFIPIPKTPFIVVLAFLSLKLHKKEVKDLGFTKLDNWKKIMLVSFLIALLYQLSGYFTDPILESLAGAKPDVSSFNEIKGNFTLLILYFLLIWTLAAFGEIFSYRDLY